MLCDDARKLLRKGRNQTKVGLKVVERSLYGLSMRGKKSDQGGIESVDDGMAQP